MSVYESESLIFVHVHKYVNLKMIWYFVVLHLSHFLEVDVFCSLGMMITIAWDGMSSALLRSSIISYKVLKIVFPA